MRRQRVEVRAAHRALPPRRALLGERARALLGVLAHVDRLPDRVGGRRTSAAIDEVDGALRRRDRQRRVRGDPLGELLGRVVQRRHRHDPVDEPDVVRARGGERLAGDEQLHRDARRDEPRQRRRPRRAAADLHLGDREARVVRRDAQVAHLGEQEAACVGDAVDRGDRGLVDADRPAEHREELGRRHLEADRRHLLQVRARAERDVAAAREHEHRRVVVVEPRRGVEAAPRAPRR